MGYHARGTCRCHNWGVGVVVLIIGIFGFSHDWSERRDREERSMTILEDVEEAKRGTWVMGKYYMPEAGKGDTRKCEACERDMSVRLLDDITAYVDAYALVCRDAVDRRRLREGDA